MPEPREPIPRAPLIHGLLGLIPFLAPPVVAWISPGLTGPAISIQTTYAALILSFLGGARWGFAISRPRPHAVTVSLSMLPTLAAFAIIVLTKDLATRLAGLAIALTIQGLWDARPGGGPPWYPRLRLLLSIPAVAGLALDGWLAHG